MKKIKVVQYSITHEHAVGKIDSLRKMSDVYEIVGVVDVFCSPAFHHDSSGRLHGNI